MVVNFWKFTACLSQGIAEHAHCIEVTVLPDPFGEFYGVFRSPSRVELDRLERVADNFAQCVGIVEFGGGMKE